MCAGACLSDRVVCNVYYIRIYAELYIKVCLYMNAKVYVRIHTECSLTPICVYKDESSNILICKLPIYMPGMMRSCAWNKFIHMMMRYVNRCKLNKMLYVRHCIISSAFYKGPQLRNYLWNLIHASLELKWQIEIFYRIC